MNIDRALVRRLVSAQFPRWANLPIRPVEVGGVDNRTFRLGARMTVRLPSAARYALQVEKEHRWLPKLAPHLPLPIPVPLARGVPAEGYPWQWSIYRWLEGGSVAAGGVEDPVGLAVALADFLTALHRVDPTDGPPPGPHNFSRGGPLTVYDGQTRQAIVALGGRIDTEAASAVWEAALASSWPGRPVWFHGDVAAGNLLLRGGRLSAVIDFGTSGVGDPSCDLAIAWTLFEGESREAFRSAVRLDQATWARGRGWALWKALITLSEHVDTEPALAETSRRVIREVFADYESVP